MYFPYIRGKKYELLALSESAEGIKNSGKIFPVIEPVRRNPQALSRTLRVFQERSIPYILIVNPSVGQLKDRPNVVSEWIADGTLSVHGRALPA